MGFIVNSYDQCVANKVLDGHQCTIIWHVDDLMISHANTDVVTEVIKQLENVYGELKATRGNMHTFVGMDIKYNEDGSVTFDMSDHVNDILKCFLR